MDKVLSCKNEDLEDYYGLLGCDELSSTEQIVNEYKIRALACHPDKHLDNPSAVTDFQKLQEAKEVLCDENKRKNYDLWKRSGVAMTFHDWQALKDSVKTSMHWAVKSRKEPMLEPCKSDIPTSSEMKDQFDHEEAQTDKSPLTEPTRDYDHMRFRWDGDSPSNLLQRFRNYEI
ncbi:dnaJ homolog subfamily C member 12 [Boleophthalmus pectinirostris]|uniref:dnaJ homolog subfamily C member 12 n=1 Tax=Boleophthalmus pectinirostris TaxID=150288 RepID=UPI000A1C6A0C|nr:dnaJ homolog subfamily C member 12 [Boleophthalmus pectinirostris]